MTKAARMLSALAMTAAVLGPCAAQASAYSWSSRGYTDRWPGGGQRGAELPARDALPNPRLTPGAVNPAVTQGNLRTTICRRGGYTRSIRPPEWYTERLKRQQIREYGYPDRRLGDFEADHLVALELGGAPASPLNIWPEPHRVVGGWGSAVKDRLENRLHDLVCEGRLPLASAQRMIAGDWIAAYRRFVGSTPRAERWGQHAW